MRTKRSTNKAHTSTPADSFWYESAMVDTKHAVCYEAITSFDAPDLDDDDDDEEENESPYDDDYKNAETEVTEKMTRPKSLKATRLSTTVLYRRPTKAILLMRLTRHLPAWGRK